MLVTFMFNSLFKGSTTNVKVELTHVTTVNKTIAQSSASVALVNSIIRSLGLKSQRVLVQQGGDCDLDMFWIIGEGGTTILD